jgi:hypothetical protein
MRVLSTLMAHFNISVKCLSDIEAAFLNLTFGLRVRSMARCWIAFVVDLRAEGRLTHCS